MKLSLSGRKWDGNDEKRERRLISSHARVYRLGKSSLSLSTEVSRTHLYLCKSVKSLPLPIARRKNIVVASDRVFELEYRKSHMLSRENYAVNNKKKKIHILFNIIIFNFIFFPATISPQWNPVVSAYYTERPIYHRAVNLTWRDDCKLTLLVNAGERITRVPFKTTVPCSRFENFFHFLRR